MTLGPAAPQEAPWVAQLDVVVTGSEDPEEGLLDFTTSDASALDPSDLLLGLSSPGFPFRLFQNDNDGWTAFAFLDDVHPLFAFRGGECIFWKRERWRAAIGFLLLHRVYRLRRDAIFFHAATVDMNGSGVMFIGPKGAGKSTTSLALAARGFPLLGDETACYVPETGMLEPFRRPVGIKPGPRARALDEALRRIGRNVAGEIVRIDVDELIETKPPSSVPVRAIVFLAPFRAAPLLERIEAGREEMALLQPAVSSLVSAPRAKRVFQLAQLLASTAIYRLHPADPDATAAMLAGKLGGIAA